MANLKSYLKCKLKIIINDDDNDNNNNTQIKHFSIKWVFASHISNKYIWSLDNETHSVT